MADPFASLQADCARCRALCCVGPAFAASADFADDKPAGRPCVHLGADDRCRIHEQLRPRGFPGCVAYDCFGAGQHVVQVTFGGGERSPAMFAVLPSCAGCTSCSGTSRTSEPGPRPAPCTAPRAGWPSG